MLTTEYQRTDNSEPIKFCLHNSRSCYGLQPKSVCMFYALWSDKFDRSTYVQWHHTLTYGKVVIEHFDLYATYHCCQWAQLHCHPSPYVQVRASMYGAVLSVNNGSKGKVQNTPLIWHKLYHVTNSSHVIGHFLRALCSLRCECYMHCVA